jgi:hypothetical protein
MFNMQYVTDRTHPLCEVYHSPGYRDTTGIKNIELPNAVKAIADPSSPAPWLRLNQRTLCGCALRLIQAGDAEAMKVLSDAGFSMGGVAKELKDEELKAWYQILKDALHHRGRGHPTIGFLLGEAAGVLSDRKIQLPPPLRGGLTSKISRLVGLTVLGGLLLLLLVAQDRYNPWFRIWSAKKP